MRRDPGPTALPDPDSLRTRYRPDEIRILFVGESPPAGGTFFYAANSKLYFATVEAFEQSVSSVVQGDFRSAFAGLGCYLDDLCLRPVNNLNLRDRTQKTERLREREAGEEPLAARMKTWSPKAIVVVVTGIEANVRRAAGSAGHGSIPLYALPFPGRSEHKARYVRELAALLRGFERLGVLVPAGR